MEQLPYEIREMILQHCYPREVLALIAASPLYLQQFQGQRTSILRPTLQLIDSTFSTELVREVSLRIVSLRFRRALLANSYAGMQHQMHPPSSHQPGSLIFSRSQWRHHLLFLAHFMELVDEVKYLVPKLTPYVTATYSDWRVVMILHAMPEKVLKCLSAIELQCQSILLRNDLARPAGTWYQFAFLPGIDNIQIFDKLRIGFDCLAREHRLIVEEIARQLRVTAHREPCSRAMYPLLNSRSKGEELDWIRRQNLWPNVDSNYRATRLFLFIRLRNRTWIEHELFINHLVAFGIKLVCSLNRMTIIQRRDYILEEFLAFCLALWRIEEWPCRDHATQLVRAGFEDALATMGESMKECRSPVFRTRLLNDFLDRSFRNVGLRTDKGYSGYRGTNTLVMPEVPFLNWLGDGDDVLMEEEEDELMDTDEVEDQT
ncbi:hypothetical protein F4819DRAFT_481720 [Hypoxylon fuscum]|nr:hypothetical protein F4819DRAFT_481720 [Hypoxylon fuscum]